MNQSIILQVVTELKEEIDPSYNLQKYFKKPIRFLGVRSPQIWKVAKHRYPSHLPKQKLLELCTELLELEIYEYAMVAFRWAYLGKEKFNREDFPIFERWLYKYITNWGLCDTYVPYLPNDFLTKYPSLMQNVRNWTKSDNELVRRASAVIFLRYSGGAKPTLQKLKDVFWVANALLEDEEDLVQKGCGWLLKNASMEHQQEVFEFVMQNKHRMQRTILRYAIEKMPHELKKIAMKKTNSNKEF